MKRLARWAALTLMIGGTVFTVGGTWRDPMLWAYTGIFAAVGLIALLSIDEDLARERFNPPTPGADRLWLRAIRLTGVAHLVMGALDTGRLHWTDSVPQPLRFLGLAGLAMSFGLVIYAMRTNRFFSSVVRMQPERGHRVVDDGPYGIVRHPGYAGMIPFVPFSGLALGSWASFAIGLVFSLLIVRRVRFEDRFLHEHLAGYADYAQRVRYRLVPGAW